MSETRATRIHIAVGVSDLEASKEHYSKILRHNPTRVAEDQIDWILDDPHINFSIFHNPDRPIGIEHMGLDFPRSELAKAVTEYGGEDVIMDPDNIRFELFSSDK